MSNVLTESDCLVLSSDEDLDNEIIAQNLNNGVHKELIRSIKEKSVSELDHLKSIEGKMSENSNTRASDLTSESDLNLQLSDSDSNIDQTIISPEQNLTGLSLSSLAFNSTESSTLEKSTPKSASSFIFKKSINTNSEISCKQNKLSLPIEMSNVFYKFSSDNELVQKNQALKAVQLSKID